MVNQLLPCRLHLSSCQVRFAIPLVSGLIHFLIGESGQIIEALQRDMIFRVTKSQAGPLWQSHKLGGEKSLLTSIRLSFNMR
jgi:hypothetical protein